MYLERDLGMQLKLVIPFIRCFMLLFLPLPALKLCFPFLLGGWLPIKSLLQRNQLTTYYTRCQALCQRKPRRAFCSPARLSATRSSL